MLSLKRPKTASLRRPDRRPDLGLSALGVGFALSLLVGAACRPAEGPCDAGTTHDLTVHQPDMSLSPVELGAMVAKKNGCHGCHDPNDPMAGVLSGQTVPLMGTPAGTMVYPANITPDQNTGIGSWTDDNFTSATRAGIDDQGQLLCMAMPRFYNMSDTDLKNLIAYLRSLPAVNRTIPDSVCPPLKM